MVFQSDRYRTTWQDFWSDGAITNKRRKIDFKNLHYFLIKILIFETFTTT